MSKTKAKIEFGDFQTPPDLTKLMLERLNDLDFDPTIIIEPTCGVGEILLQANAALRPRESLGIEINTEYAKAALQKANSENGNIRIINADIFTTIRSLEICENESYLLIGNPPWVTNSGIGAISGENLPTKQNLKGLRGIDAITGKSNFDVAEYILLKLLQRFYETQVVFAFLCKTIVARNLLKHLWANDILYSEARIYPIDSMKYFNAAVDACFFVIDFRQKTENKTCKVFDSIEGNRLATKYGFHNHLIVNDIDNFVSHNFFGKSQYVWRNGVKHDCTKVMELSMSDDGHLINQDGELVDIEEALVYPLLKSSDLCKEVIRIRRYVIMTQKNVGQDTSYISEKYPKTWAYLSDHALELSSRKSSIYRNKPKFSIFSVGDYSFAPFKIAISGLYKQITFQKLSSHKGKAMQVDDTCNYISCYTEDEAETLYQILTSKQVTAYLNSVIFWDSKRPITTELLNSIDLRHAAEQIGLAAQYDYACARNKVTVKERVAQPSLFV